MLKVASYDIVFQEVPGEVTLALNISGCPCHCKGCHSQHLWVDTGEPLGIELLDGLLARYGGLATCVAFMGGDQAPEEVAQLANHLKLQVTDFHVKTAWYSGRPQMPNGWDEHPEEAPFDYIKIGPYIESLGGLKSRTTNQRLYKRSGCEWLDVTSSYWRQALG